MKPLDIEEIITAYLVANGFDGLAGDECGCVIGDLFPCDCANPRCVPGYRHDCVTADCTFTEWGTHYHVTESREPSQKPD